MTRSFRSLLAVTAALIATSCKESPITGPITSLPRELTASETHLIAAGNDFAFKLFEEIAHRADQDSNVFVSPLSVSMALGMTLNGAVGATRDSMQHTLGLEGLSLAEIDASYRGVIDLLRGLDRGVEFTLANSIWHRNDIVPGQAFLDDARTWFDAQIRALDFQSPNASRTINDWVNTQTRGRISEIVPDPLPRDEIMYLINAIYFKGSWTKRFDPDLTRDQPFHLRTGGTATAHMMSHADPAPVRSFFGSDVTVVDLPYGGRAYSMTIVMPRTAAGIDSLVAGLTHDRWDAWMAALDTNGAVVTMPKFTLRWGDSLNAVLKTLGMRVAFCGPWSTDFSRLYPAPVGDSACITDVQHKTYLDIYEEGTEAAAVTSVGVGITTCCSGGPPHIVVDRPFVLAIRERFSGTILFLGRIMNPAAT